MPQLLLTILAAAAALARNADGQLAIPQWLACLLQAPAIVCHLWHSLSSPSRRTSADTWIFLLALAGAVAAAIHNHSSDPFFICTTVYLVGRQLLMACTNLAARLERSLSEPLELTRILFRPWLASVFILTVLLSLPVATHSGVPDFRHNFWLHVSNCAFSAASAASLVGTSIYSFGEDFSLFGQVVLILETQLCGMAFAAIGLAIIRPVLLRNISLRTLWSTCLLAEIAGILLMCGRWHEADAATASAQLGWSAVHAISALWNSGFTMKAGGLAEYLVDGRIFASVTVLAILGSLGVPLILDLLLIRKPKDDPRPRIGPLTHLAGWEAGITFLFLFGVAILLFSCETPRVLSEGFTPVRPFDMETHLVPMHDERSHGDRWRIAVFVSATLRSAGLQSIPVAAGAVSWPSFVTILLSMIVGGSAGGTAGGFRTSILTLLCLCLFFNRSTWGNRPDGESIRRRIAKTLGLFASLWLLMNALAVLLLAASSQGTWYEWSFESVAALNNVGLSTGLSLHLTPAGRLTMIGLMMIGRWVPMIFWLRIAATLTEHTKR